MNTTLAKTVNCGKELDDLALDLNELVKSASRVIAPYGPIDSFAARSPWAGLEDQTFEKTARKLKDLDDVDLYPDDSIVQSAWNRGEIQKDFLERALQQWLNSQRLELPREDAERFCRNALLLDQPSWIELSATELKSLAKKLNHLVFKIKDEYTIRTYSQRLDMMGSTQTAQDLNRHMIKWCKLFLDTSQAVWMMPNREEGFYQSWRRLIQYDPALDRRIRRQLNQLPKEADNALMEALLALEIPYSEMQGYLEAHLLALPGWSGMILWRSQQSTQENSLLIDYLAVRITMEHVLLKPYLPLPEQKSEVKISLEQLIAAWANWAGMTMKEWSQLPAQQQKARLSLAYRFDKMLRNRLWLEAWEKTYEDQLRKMLTSKQSSKADQVQPAMAQFAFCIDVRSEPFRRKLEKAGPIETFGTAGFYGLPIETCKLDSQHSHRSLPVMSKPQLKVIETTSEEDLKQHQQRKHAVNSVGFVFKEMKHNLLTSLLLPEISGPWLSLQTLLRSFIPRSFGLAFHNLSEKWLQKPSTKLSLDYEHNSASELPVGFTEKEKVQYVLQALKTMGLTEHFAPLVVISGHGSHSTNNPYASALDCGACGGASSGFNARVLAELCNLPNVRKALAKEGISIPIDTVFVAAEHITSLDEFRWIYVPQLSNPAKEAFNRINAVLPKVSEEAKEERIMQLPRLGNHRKKAKDEAKRFAEDWSEVRPEWGLARNAAFIIGGRRLTEECDLEGRVFLHNYNWRKDKNGALLASIITGPATVAQWINLQYFASTVAPHYYGSGNKATQTVTSGIGVMQGNASDLLTGLPWQSVMKSDQEVFHAPIRLLVVIQAPKDYVKRLLEHVPDFQQKVQNGWIRLASIGPDGHWESWS
ncbi:DUF2309 domain-containing protein [Bacillota bacterium Lsc_1132]